jgi:hypothetical protein
MDLKTRYKVKGVGTEKVIESVIVIKTEENGERIVSVEDRWNGSIPEGPIATVCRCCFYSLETVWRIVT